MTQDEQAKNPDAQPTWKDLAEYTSKQAENDRKLIDSWFKLAGTLIGIIVLIASGAFAFLGWKTIDDVKKSAGEAAREAAKAKVEEVLRQPDVQKLVRETASDLFEKGVFRKEIEGKVGELISAEMASLEFRKLIVAAARGELTARTAPRDLTEFQAKIIADSLGSVVPAGHVSIRTGSLPEQQLYARKLSAAISRSWKGHVSYAEPGTWAGLTDNTNLLLEGIVVVVNDTKNVPGFANALEAAFQKAKIAGVRLGPCNCAEPPKSPDIWVYVGEKQY